MRVPFIAGEYSPLYQCNLIQFCIFKLQIHDWHGSLWHHTEAQLHQRKYQFNVILGPILLDAFLLGFVIVELDLV